MYTYYTEMVLELAALSVEFLHHTHMLVGVASWEGRFSICGIVGSPYPLTPIHY